MGPEQAYQIVCEYLDNPSSVSGAVLIDGAWGVGKTHLLQRVLSRSSGEQLRKTAYVSCYGVNSTKDIDAHLFASAHPWLSSKPFRFAQDVLTSIPLLSNGKPIELSEFLENAAFDLIVFDDLERTNISLHQVLGYINFFVEHTSARIICASASERLRPNDRTTFKDSREKVFARRIVLDVAEFDTIKSIGERVLPRLYERVSHDLQLHFYNVLRVSGAGNIRAYLQALGDALRWLAHTEPSWADNDQAVRHWITHVLIAYLEIRSGNTDKDEYRDFLSRRMRMLFDDSQGKDREKLEIEERYTELGFTPRQETALAANDFEDVGDIEVSRVTDSLVRDGIIRKSNDNEPGWLTLWNFGQRATEDIEAAHAEGLRLLRSREVLDWSEFAHWVDSMMYIARCMGSKPDWNEAVKLANEYVQRLRSDGNIDAMNVPWFDHEFDSLGYAYLADKDEQSQVVMRGLWDSAKGAKEAVLVKKYSSALVSKRGGVEIFLEAVYGKDKHRLEKISLLRNVSVKTVADRLLSMGQDAAFQFCLALFYCVSPRSRPMAPKEDKDFVRNLVAELRRRSEALSKIERAQVLYLMRTLSVEELPEDRNDWA